MTKNKTDKKKYKLVRVDKNIVDYFEGKTRKFRHYKNSDGFEWWKEYDERGNEIHFKNSDGFEQWKEYDERGNEIHYKNSDGFERGQKTEEEPEYIEPFTFQKDEEQD